jgi:hypothetical protein
MEVEIMKTLFVGIVAVALLAILATPVFADTFPVEAGPGNRPPEIYLLESYYDICGAESGSIPGGSRPYIPVNGIQDAQSDGCIELFDDIRFDEYAFTGEQIGFLVAVRDLNGAPDIGYAYFTVDGQHEVLCNDITSWYSEHEFWEQIPAKPFAHQGLAKATDKVFECILTVEPSWYGESFVSIEAMDQAGAVTDNGIAQTWFFNPAIIVDLSTNDGAPSIEFEEGYPGQTVMSTNKLMITNLAEGGVDLWAFMAADDLTDPSHSGAKCPISNVLDTDTQMEFRCKIGTFEDDNWDYITNKDTSDSCGWHEENCIVIGPLEETETPPIPPRPKSLWVQCLGALPLLYEEYTMGPRVDTLTPPTFRCIDPSISIIKNQASAECQFRLTYPVPCIGDFTEGAFHVIVRAL